MSEEKPDVYKEGGNWYYRASSLGGCKRALIAQKLGYEVLPTPDWMEGTYQAGKDAEPIAIEMLREQGWRVYDQQREVRLAIDDGVYVIGHVDALGEHYSQYDESPAVIEVKSQSALEYAKGINWGQGLWPKYQWQMSVYKLACRAPLAVVRFNRGTEDLDITRFESEYSFERIADRVMSVHNATELPVTCSVKNHPCSVFYLCENTGEVYVEKDGRVGEDEGTVIQLAKDYRQAEVRATRFKNQAREIRARLREIVGSGKHSFSDSTTINFYNQRNPRQVDWDAIKAAYPGFDKANYMKDGEMNERLRIQLPED